MQFNDSSLWDIAPDGTATELVTGLNSSQGLDWGGGTGYGDYLYCTSNSNIYEIGLDGSVSVFTYHWCAGGLAIDITGNYGGYMYTSTGCQDHIYEIDFSGNDSMFSDWPTWIDGGGPQDICFDSTGRYGGQMFVATDFIESQSHVSGVFALDTLGNATRFTNEIVAARTIAFDEYGLFGNDMFVVGTSSFEGIAKIWRVQTDGTATGFADVLQTSPMNIAFGSDGAMYVAEYSSADELVTVSRIMPIADTPKIYHVDGVGGDNGNDGLT
ncbi:unnamed protein product, partial [marine sediment metagenome]